MKTCLAMGFMLLGVESRGVEIDGRGERMTLSLHDRHGSYGAQVATKAAVVREGHSKHRAALGKAPIVPPLVDVDTDKKFFGPPFPADYPDDISPPTKRKLFKKDSVYPKVQEEGFFDKDYIKDENSDGGKWQAQFDYDSARTKIANQQRQAENAAKRAGKEQHDVETASGKVAETRRKEEAAAEEAKKAQDEAAAAEEAARRNAQKKADERAAEARVRAEKQEEEEKEQRRTLEKRVQDAEDKLTEEKKEYKECLKQLQEAKDKVDELEKQKRDLKKKGWNTTKWVVAETQDLEAERKAVEEATAKTAAAEAKHKATLKNLEAAHEATEAAKRELEQQKRENERAHNLIEEQDRELEKAEKDLDSSKSKLRHIRGLDEPKPKDPKEDGGAVSQASSLVVAAVLTIMATF